MRLSILYHNVVQMAEKGDKVELFGLQSGAQHGLGVSMGGEDSRVLREDGPDFPSRLGPSRLHGLGSSARELFASGTRALRVQTAVAAIFQKVWRICIGLNYRDYPGESGFRVSEYPSVFSRLGFLSAGDGVTIIRATNPEQFDGKGDLVAILGESRRHFSGDAVLLHISGYSIFNEASARHVQCANATNRRLARTSMALAHWACGISHNRSCFSGRSSRAPNRARRAFQRRLFRSGTDPHAQSHSLKLA
ncbi:fumarylacetoacetate hydrolase family protein [Variovorax fucosicus]|uniref:fumarylacetoacetate hydrolase family protein n=1 Tax=Variovorax fucosicus TaxID=3053517 RepID=UPI0033653848